MNIFELIALIESIKQNVSPSTVKHTVKELSKLVEMADEQFGGVEGLVEAVRETRPSPPPV